MPFDLFSPDELEILNYLESRESDEMIEITQLATDLIEMPDSLMMLETIKTLELLNPDQITELAQMLDICPIHLIDHEICNDDAYPQIADCAEFH